MAGSSKGQAAALAAEHFMLHEHANDAGMAKCSTVGGGAVSIGAGAGCSSSAL